jgi:hypothetical protein
MDTLHTIKDCEVCGSANLVPLLDLGDQPMCDDLTPIGSDLTPPSDPLRLVGCERCNTVHQAVQVDKKALFPQSYHYRAAMTADVLQGMEDLVNSVEARFGSLDGKVVLDIGCNDGSLLSVFKGRGARACGIEPTGASADASPKVDWLHNGYFDAHAVELYLADNPKPDYITFTNVFAHIEDLRGLLANLRKVAGEATKFVIENHYLGAVVAKRQFDTFYHEHPRTYSANSFMHIAEQLGRNVELIEFPSRYNGNIRVVMGNGPRFLGVLPDESGFLSAVKDMQPIVAEGRLRTQAKLLGLVARYGPLPAKALPGRAVILVHSLGINEAMIDATYERSASPKVGHYVPGTRIEIRDEAEFFANRLGSPVLINLAWHIQAEIERYMRGKGFAGQILPIWE